MAKRVTKKAVNSNEMDGKEFFEAIHQIEQEKGIKPGYMMEKVTQALLSAYRRDHEGTIWSSRPTRRRAPYGCS